MNYDNLTPGLYIQHGSNIKRIGEQGDPIAAALTGHNYNEPERLASAVGWVFIALNKRTTQMKELFQYSQWASRQSGNEVDELPFAFKINREITRIDYALQLHGQAYLFKQRRGRRLVGVRWFDPSTIQPDPASAEVVNGGARWNRYIRTDPITHQRTFIDAKDIIHFIIPGQRELEPGTPAGLATKTAGNILLGMGEMFSTFYENNALPVMLIEVPAATSNEDKDAIKSALWRVFNPRRGSRENRTVGVREGVKITPLSINPESLDAIPLEDSQIRQIVTAHDIPYEIVATAANYAVSQDRRRDFVGSIGQRMAEIGGIVNEDVDFINMGLMWTVDPEQHWAMKRDEQAASSSALNWVAAGMTPQAAAYLLGITEERFPNELITKYGIWRVTEEPDNQTDMGDIGGAASPVIDGDMEDAASDMKAVEAGQFRRWLKKRTNPDPSQFKALYLSDSDKRMIMESEPEPEPEPADTAGDDMKAAFFETLAKVEAALTGV